MIISITITQPLHLSTHLQPQNLSLYTHLHLPLDNFEGNPDSISCHPQMFNMKALPDFVSVSVNLGRWVNIGVITWKDFGMWQNCFLSFRNCFLFVFSMVQWSPSENPCPIFREPGYSGFQLETRPSHVKPVKVKGIVHHRSFTTLISNLTLIVKKKPLYLCSCWKGPERKMRLWIMFWNISSSLCSMFLVKE